MTVVDDFNLLCERFESSSLEERRIGPNRHAFPCEKFIENVQLINVGQQQHIAASDLFLRRASVLPPRLRNTSSEKHEQVQHLVIMRQKQRSRNLKHILSRKPTRTVFGRNELVSGANTLADDDLLRRVSRPRTSPIPQPFHLMLPALDDIEHKGEEATEVFIRSDGLFKNAGALGKLDRRRYNWI